MKVRALVVTLSALAIAGACTPAAETAKHDPAADVAAIGKLRDDYMAAFKSANATAMAGLYMADGRSMTNGQPTAASPQAVETANKAMMDQMSATEIVITPEKTEVSGDMAYDRGTFRMSMTPKAGGAAVTDEGRYLVVLRRMPDGAWKIAEEMGNSATPPMAPPPAKK